MTADPAQAGDGPAAAPPWRSLPSSTSFELGWVMAQLFDERRLEVRRTRAFDRDLQLPMVADLDPAHRRDALIAELADLGALYPVLSVQGVLVAARSAAFDGARFLQAVRSLHFEIIDALIAEPAQISAYHLGIALSDLCWIPSKEGGAESFLRALRRDEIAELHVLLRTASTVLPNLAAATVSKSVEAWQGWANATAARLARDWPARLADPVVAALRIQGDIWHQVLTVESLGENEAGQGLRALTAIRRFRLALVVLLAAGIALYLTVKYTAGAGQIWAAVATIITALGLTGANLASAARTAASAFTWSPQVTAQAQARAWSVTHLPAMPLSLVERRRLRQAGVPAPPVRVNLDAPRARADKAVPLPGQPVA